MAGPRVKGYKKTNYYAKSTIRTAAKETNVSIDQGTGLKLIRNVYVHSGLYNFRTVVKGYQNASSVFLGQLKSTLNKDFKKEIHNAKMLEKKIYAAAGKNVNSGKDLQNFLTFDARAQQVLDSLDIYGIFEAAIENLPESSPGYADVRTVQKRVSAETSKALTNVAQQLQGAYADVFEDYKNSFLADNFFIAQKTNQVAIKQLQNGKNFFMNASKYQGNLGEFAALIDLIAKTNGTAEFTSEIQKSVTRTGNIKVKGIGSMNLKSDIGINFMDLDFGIQAKNYKDPLANISIHSNSTSSEKNTSTIVSNLFETPIIAQASNELKLNKLFNDTKAGTNAKDFQKFLQYCIINAQAFKSSGVYVKPQHKKPVNKKSFMDGVEAEEGKKKALEAYKQALATNTYSSQKVFAKEAVLVQQLTGYLAAYWIGVKILDGNKKLKNKRVAFYYLGDKIVPLSEILQAVYDTLSAENPVIVGKFKGVKVFTPSVLKEEKWRALQKSSNPPKKWNRRREYPEGLLRVGSGIGKASLDNLTFSIEMNVKSLFKI